MLTAELLDKNSSQLVIIDFQERLADVMAQRQQVEANIVRLAKFAAILKVPTIITEQYPRGIGTTTKPVREIIEKTQAFKPIEKIQFSCCGVVPFDDELLKNPMHQQLVLTGIETHVCVLQSAIQAVSSGFHVFVVADAVTSRSTLDYERALDRMKATGVHIVTTEMVAFEWLRHAGTPEFKAIHPLIA